MDKSLKLSDFAEMGDAISDFMASARTKEGALLVLVGYAIDNMPKKEQVSVLKNLIKNSEVYIANLEETA